KDSVRFRLLLVIFLTLSGYLPESSFAGSDTPGSACARSVTGALRRAFSSEAASPSGIKGYFLMPRLFKNGKLRDIAQAMPELKKMGVNTLWISPPNPQTGLIHP